MKFIGFFTLLFISISCKSNKKIVQDSIEEELPLLTNDSVFNFLEIDKKISRKVENKTSLSNPITEHFNKHISKSALKKVVFKEWRKKIYIEFSINKRKQITYIKTNTASKKLDKQLKKAFKKINFNLFDLPEYDPLYKFTLVVIQQNTIGEPIIKCSEKVIGYTPPVFEICSSEKNYHDLNNCNYIYITSYIYQHLDFSLATIKDIDFNHKIYPKFIINKKGKVVAAKIESQNKDLLEDYYKNIKSLPKAEKPAKIDGEPYYYGYNFPSSISNMVRNNEKFKKFFLYEKDNGQDIRQNVKKFIQMEIIRKEREKIYRVGF